MTSNQIDYYNARMKAKHDRLSRKESKRHNLATEQAQNISASAAMQSAAAAASQAGTAAKRYQLEWENEYGLPYGSDPQDPSNYSQFIWDEGVYGGFPRGATTQSYAYKQYEIVKTGEQARTEQANRAQKYGSAAANFVKGVKDAVGTYFIITGG